LLKNYKVNQQRKMDKRAEEQTNHIFMSKKPMPDMIFDGIKVGADYADVPVFDTPNPEPLPASMTFDAESLKKSERPVFAEKQAPEHNPEQDALLAPKKKLREKAQEKVESILNLRTFLFVAGLTALLALYISNVIAINRLSGETELLKKELEDARSVNVELDSKLKALQRVEHVSAEAYKKLGLRYKTEPPVELNAE
jgi:hypothetical protein